MPGPNTFPQHERLTRKREFLLVYQEGEKRVSRAFVCYVARREGQGRKLGLAVSRKVGNAVVRNRVKRYIRELYRTQRRFLRSDAHIVVVARPSAGRLTFDECSKDLGELFRSGHAWGG